MSNRQFLIVGTGARRHALARRLVAEGCAVWLAPSSPALAEPSIQVAPVAMDAIGPLAQWAATQRIDTAVILNENLLFNGMADAFTRAGVACLGASQAAAMIERSKIFAHIMMQTLGIACPPWRVYGTVTDAIADTGRFTYPVVVKTDGPAVRTGVIIARNAGEARDALKQLSKHEIGSGPVLIEQFVPGFEISVSVLAGAPGEMVLWPVVRAFNQLGANQTAITHGMGALAPVPVEEAVVDIVVDWLGRLVTALGSQGPAFRGWLTTNAILGPRGPELLECNCHVVDPELQTMLPVIHTPLADLLSAAARGDLADRVDLHRSATTAAATINLVRPGYPGVATGSVRIPRTLANREEISLYETTTGGDDLLPTGGRVMSCTASASGLDHAAAAARALAADVAAHVPGLSFRNDIDARPDSSAHLETRR